MFWGCFRCFGGVLGVLGVFEVFLGCFRGLGGKNMGFSRLKEEIAGFQWICLEKSPCSTVFLWGRKKRGFIKWFLLVFCLEKKRNKRGC